MRWEDGESPRTSVSEIRHARFLRAMKICASPGTRQWRRIEYATACILGRRSWRQHRKPLGTRNRGKAETWRIMVASFAADGGEFTYLKAQDWLRINAGDLRRSRMSVATYLRCNAKRLGIRRVHRFVNGPVVWRVLG